MNILLWPLNSNNYCLFLSKQRHVHLKVNVYIFVYLMKKHWQSWHMNYNIWHVLSTIFLLSSEENRVKLFCVNFRKEKVCVYNFIRLCKNLNSCCELLYQSIGSNIFRIFKQYKTQLFVQLNNIIPKENLW